MEDPESEWAIQEYSPPKEGEASMVKWILNKGYNIGKKMVVTGIVISSAPLVLPPLVVFSAMGVAFSVPFGLVLASYVSTNTIMSKLLPTPTPSPLLLEYYPYEDEEEDVDSTFDLHEGGDDYRQKIEGGVTYTNEYEDDEENVTQEEKEERMYETEEKVEALMTNVGDVDEKGYYTDDEEKEGEDEKEMENGDEYTQEMEALIGKVENLDENEDEKEGEDGKEMENGDEYRQEMEALIGKKENLDENEDEEEADSKFDLLYEGGDDYRHKEVGVPYTNEYEDDKLRKENVMQEQEEDRIYETEEKVEALMTNVGDVDEKGYYTGDEEKEMENGDEYRQETEALIGKVENFDENDDEKEKEDEDEDDVVEREYDIEEEEGEQMEDINQGIEMRLGFDMANIDDNKQTQEVSTTNSSGVDDQGYEEDDSLQEEEDVEVTKDESEEIVKESTGLLEKLRDEGKVDDNVGDESDLNGVFEEGKNFEMIEPVMVKEIESQIIVKDGSENEEVVGGIHRVVILDEGNEENSFISREVEELDLVAREVVGDGNKEGKNIEVDEKETKEDMEVTGGDTSNVENEDAILNSKKEHLVHSNEDAREIGDESGLDLFDDRNKNMNIEILEGGNEVKENTVDDNVDVMSLPGFRHAPLDSDNPKVVSKTDKKTPSREDVLEDEKIWEKIGAMRAIVGYKAPSQPTFLGELKALYVFTGLEPPASFKSDSSDRDEVNAKLKFLMSVVGVK